MRTTYLRVRVCLRACLRTCACARVHVTLPTPTNISEVVVLVIGKILATFTQHYIPRTIALVTWCLRYNYRRFSCYLYVIVNSLVPVISVLTSLQQPCRPAVLVMCIDVKYQTLVLGRNFEFLQKFDIQLPESVFQLPIQYLLLGGLMLFFIGSFRHLRCLKDGFLGRYSWGAAIALIPNLNSTIVLQVLFGIPYCMMISQATKLEAKQAILCHHLTNSRVGFAFLILMNICPFPSFYHEISYHFL